MPGVTTHPLQWPDGEADHKTTSSSQDMLDPSLSVSPSFSKYKNAFKKKIKYKKNANTWEITE